jgi:exosortase A-associated hydrolase 2
MNKSRRIVTDLAQHERARGRGLLCVDLFGTGDSDGDFADARVGRWLEDLSAAVDWSARRGWPVTSLLGIRFGALLGAEFLRQGNPGLSRVVLWQPVVSGARMMEQFLRIRVMATRMEHGRGESVSALRAQLKAGDTVEVGGYALSGSLCADIDALDLGSALIAPFPPVRWLDVVADTAAPVAPATGRTIAKARAADAQIDHAQIAGEPFWMATEIVTNSALVAAS